MRHAAKNLVRYGGPVLIAISLMAFVVVPLADRALEQWFRRDLDLRAKLLASAIEQPVADLLARGDEAAIRDYLTRVTADERLVAMLLCRADGTTIVRTALAAPSISCRPGQPPATSDAGASAASGALEISAFAFRGLDGEALRLVLVHDLTFIHRRQSLVRDYVLASGALLATVLALVAGLGTWLLLRRWVGALVGDIESLRFSDVIRTEARGSSMVLSRVRRVLRDIEQRQRLEIDFQENWTAQALQQVVRDYLGSPAMLVVSNREPYIHNATDAGIAVQVPASGMVTALEPIMRACAGTWVAHGSGSADREVVDRFDRIRVPPQAPAYTLRRVWLSPEEEEGFYYGFSNEGLWPLCHLAYVRPAFREEDWRQYQTVNRRFAQVVAEEARDTQPVILLQDFHFALLPKLLRERKPRATILLFWHIPWPNAETFGVCPWKQELLQHMLSADILGFHTRLHCQNFLASVDRFVECQIDHEHMTVTLQGHVCRVAPYPISIEWPPRWLQSAPPIETARREVRARYGLSERMLLGVGVERWDFTKGILERFQAFERLLEGDETLRGRICLLQVAAPSRSKLAAYQMLQLATRTEAQRINDRFGRADWQPIVLIAEHQTPESVFELYRAADFCMVTSLHDGMNLVAKEFVAARDDERGVLILSTFAGASRELVEALIVNPFDIRETATAIRAAATMPPEEQAMRMRLMRRTLKQNNVYRWAGRMLMDAMRIRQRQALPQRPYPDDD